MMPTYSDTLRLRILDVGQGDANVILLPNCRRALVVDACDGERVLRILEDDSVEEVVLFLSHSDTDHVAGVQYLLDNFTGNFIAFFYNHDRLNQHLRSGYVSILRALAMATRDLHEPFSGNFNTNLNHDHRFLEMATPPVTIEVLHPSHDEQSSLLGTSTNEPAGVLRVVYTDTKNAPWVILLAGDVQLTGLSCMMARHGPSKLRANILKYPHHGAWPTDYPAITQFAGLERQTMTSFLEAVDPEVVVLSVGLGNSDRHVRREVFEALRRVSERKLRLNRIVCTQFTQTCLRPGESCDSPSCGGDVEIRIGESIPGSIEVLPAQAAHVKRILTVTDRAHAGCGPILPPQKS